MSDWKNMVKPGGLGILWAVTLAIAYHWGNGVRSAGRGDSSGLDTGEANGSASQSGTARGTDTARLAAQGNGGHAPGSARANAPGGDSASSEGGANAGKFEPEAEFAEILSRPAGPQRNQALENLFERWAEADGFAAIAKTAAIGEPLLRFELREAVLRHWAMKNPEEAWNFAKANANGDLPEHRMHLIIEGMSRGDIAAGLDFFAKHSKGDLMPYMGSAVGAFDRLYARGGHDLMVPWAQALPDSKMKDGAVNRIVDQWARYDPKSAKVWMERMLAGNDPNTVPARIELAESWARVNPMEALAWVESLPGKEREGEYYQRIFKRWLDYDQNGAAQYLAQQPSSPILDPAIERYTSEVASRNPANTMPWAESISDPNRRWRAIERVADAWRKKDPEGLARYVSTGNFTPDQQRSLLKLDQPQVRK